MLRSLHFFLIAFAFITYGCNQSNEATAIPTVVLDAGYAADQSTSSRVSASAQVIPAEKVELSFPLIGTIKSVNVGLGDEVSSQQVLVNLDDAILVAQVAQAQADLLAADTQYRYLQRVGTDEEHLESALADVDRAQAALDSEEATLEQSTLKAPFAGTIALVDGSPAETVVPGQVVIVMGNLRKFQVETTDLSERDIPMVKVGQKADVFIEALNETINGQVAEISGLATTLGGDVVYKVTIDLSDQPAGLRWGMSAEVEISTSE